MSMNNIGVEKIQEQIKKWHSWKYKNTCLLVLSIAVFFYFADTTVVQNIISKMGELGYAGAFVAGIFFVYTFTVAPSAVILFRLADSYNPIFVAVLAGLGAVIGDYIIFKYFRDKVFIELRPVLNKLSGPFIKKIFLTPYFAWVMPLAGLFIIASPFPDEVGVGLLGASKMRNWQFLLLAFLLNAIGIFVVVTLARSY